MATKKKRKKRAAHNPPKKTRPQKRAVKKRAAKKKPQAKIDPARMTRAEFAAVLIAVGGDELSADAVDRLVDACPFSDDDTIDLLKMTAWLAGRVS